MVHFGIQQTNLKKPHDIQIIAIFVVLWIRSRHFPLLLIFICSFHLIFTEQRVLITWPLGASSLYPLNTHIRCQRHATQMWALLLWDYVMFSVLLFPRHVYVVDETELVIKLTLYLHTTTVKKSKLLSQVNY